jgi:hypothetical protein
MLEHTRFFLWFFAANLSSLSLNKVPRPFLIKFPQFPSKNQTFLLVG